MTHSDRLHFLLFGAVLAGASVLLLAGSWFCYTSTFDTATVGLMSVNILQGDRPLFFYGQPYFGALEAYLGAFYLFLFGFSEFVISLSPISFTLGWIVVTYLLFRRIHSKEAGLIAAICTAFSGYYVFWYSIATYGGYSALLFLGTAILWLSLRILQERSTGFSLLLQCAALGVLMALGIWVHALTYPYIVIAAVVLCIYLWQARCNPFTFFSLCLAAGIGLTGFLPFYIETGSIMGGVSESVPFSSAFIVEALRNLFAVNIYELTVWNFIHSFDSVVARFFIMYGGFACLAGGFLLAFYHCIKDKNIAAKKYYLLPVSFCLLFLVLYVQHHMATIRAPRYAINFLVLLLCIIWSLALTGQKNKYLRTLTVVLFGCWVLYQISGTVFFIAGNSHGAREEQQTMEDIVKTAKKKGLTSVVTYGDTRFGYKAQKLSMFSGNRIVFANAGLERYKANAQRTESDSGKGYLTQEKHRKSLENGLRAAGVEYTITRIKDYFLFSDLHSRMLPQMELVPVSELRSFPSDVTENRLNGEWLIDRNQDVVVSLADLRQKSVIFDTGKKRMLTGIWLFNSQVLSDPQWQGSLRFEVYLSTDNMTYKRVYQSVEKAANIFHAGSHIFLSGIRAKNEALFAPQPGRYVKIVFLEPAETPVTEFFLFQKKKKKVESDVGDDLGKIQNIITEQNVDFVLADRWCSANLRESFKGTHKSEIALPRYSLKYKKSLSRYFVKAADNQAMVCERSVADECARVLESEYGSSVISKRIDLDEYTMLLLSSPGEGYDFRSRSALLWNGHVPLQTKNIELIASLLNKRGLPIWGMDFVKTKGFYQDTWSNGHGRFFGLEYQINPERDKELVIYTNGWRPGSMDEIGIKVFANHDIVLPFQRKVENAYFFSLPKELYELHSLRVQSKTFVPNSSDSRKLGLDVKRIEIQ